MNFYINLKQKGVDIFYVVAFFYRVGCTKMIKV